MKFKVHIADKSTGAESTLVVDCSSAEEASDLINAKGFLVGQVEPMISDDEGLTSPSMDYALVPDAGGDAGNSPINIRYAVGMLVYILLISCFIIGGLALISYSSQFPCVGILGILLGGVLVAFGIMLALAALGVNLSSKRSYEPNLTINTEMICPHCQVKGQVGTRSVELKKGVSGTKAAAAVLTEGVSILATGLSRKEVSTKALCMNCGNTWYF